MNKINFVILSKHTRNSMLNKCLESIRKHHDDPNIILIDSSSDDKSYYKDVENICNIQDIDNKNWMTGAIWHVYKNFDLDNLFFLQDSLLIKDNLDFVSEKIISSVRYFNSGNVIGGFPLIGDWGQGFDSTGQRNFVDINLKKFTNFRIPPSFVGLFGPMMFCKRSVLNELHECGFSNILPYNKETSCGMERAWGIALKNLGYDIKSNTVCGNHFHNLDESKIEKIFLGRT